MNIDKMINMLLISLSANHKVFYMEKRNYKDRKVYKSYNIKINSKNVEFRNKRELLLYLTNI